MLTSTPFTKYSKSILVTPHTGTHTHTLSLSLSHTHTHSLSLSLTHTHTHTVLSHKIHTVLFILSSCLTRNLSLNHTKIHFSAADPAMPPVAIVTYENISSSSLSLLLFSEDRARLTFVCSASGYPLPSLSWNISVSKINSAV